MPVNQHCFKTDTLELKAEIKRTMGHQKANDYFSILNRFLKLKLCKPDFNKLCIGIIGRENVPLHNRLIKAIINNACLSESNNGSTNVKVAKNGYQKGNLQSLCRDVFPQSPRKGRTQKIRDRPSPLGPLGKIHNINEDSPWKNQEEQQSFIDLHSIGTRPLGDGNSVEDGEEVEQAYESPGVRSRSPLRAPFGIPNAKGTTKKLLLNNGSSFGFHDATCHTVGELPDTNCLRKRLEKKLETEKVDVSDDFVYLLNNGINVFLKRLITPCLELAGSRSGGGPAIPGSNGNKPSGSISASILDFQVAMELNPQILGEEWPILLENVCLQASEK